MSLKAFHIFFIGVSTLLAFGFGIWSLRFHLDHGNLTYLLLGLSSILLGVALIFYGNRFLQKLRHLRFL